MTHWRLRRASAVAECEQRAVFAADGVYELREFLY